VANIQCPNCKQFTFNENPGSISIGVFFILGSFIIPFILQGGAEYHGGNIDATMVFFIMIIIGIIVLIKGILFPSKTTKFSCSNCKYEMQYPKK
jgi:hypothetical protein